MCKPSLSILRTEETNFSPKPAKNPVKTGKNRSKTGQKPVKFQISLSRDRPEQFLLLDFFDYLKKTFPADSGRTGRARANLRPFLNFGWPLISSQS